MLSERLVALKTFLKSAQNQSLSSEICSGSWPRKFPRNRPFFPQIYPWKSREIWPYFPRPTRSPDCSVIMGDSCIFSFASSLFFFWYIILHVVLRKVLTRVLFIHYCQYKVESTQPVMFAFRTEKDWVQYTCLIWIFKKMYYQYCVYVIKKNRGTCIQVSMAHW